MPPGENFLLQPN